MGTKVAHSPGVLRSDHARVLDGAENLIALLGSVADAERMVITWNCHDDLLSVFSDAANTLSAWLAEVEDEDWFNHDSRVLPLISKLRAAIAKEEA